MLEIFHCDLLLQNLLKEYEKDSILSDLGNELLSISSRVFSENSGKNYGLDNFLQ